MALIKCPECGKEMSDKAAMCPQCGCPIVDACYSGEVRVKMGTIRNVLSGKQEATISANGRTLWNGMVGQIAEIYLDEPTSVKIEYHFCAMHYGGKCEGIIDPAKGKKYAVVARQGFMRTLLELQRVDLIDAE